MPTLQFKGKNIIWNHHLSVPYHTLDEVEKLHFQPKKANGNMIIEGDNLLALKALLPQYTGNIKCIYIDPPYNTGNDGGDGRGWIYSDNANSPLLKEWLEKEVGIEDLARTDKWLCMMVPRLKLLRDLLTDDGVLLVSIDENEFATLNLLLDEVFGNDKQLGTFVWRRRIGSSLASSWFSSDHEYVIAYSKNPDQVNILGDERDMSKYSVPDGKDRFYASMPLTVGMNRRMRPNQWYELKHPKTGTGYFPPEGRVWCYYPPTMKEKIKQNKIIWPEDFPDKNLTTPRLKSYPEDAKRERKPLSSWINEKSDKNNSDDDSSIISSAKNEEGARILKDLLGESGFNFPKPLSLLIGLLNQFTNTDDIVLDSFAGSGTTMHAVMDVNKNSGGKRRCILIQMAEATKKEPQKNVCVNITRRRVMRAIEKYDYESGFEYYTVGIPIDAETLLSGRLPTYRQFAEYVYYLCTGQKLKEKATINEAKYSVGTYGSTVVYLVYTQNFNQLTHMALNIDLAERFVTEHPRKRLIVYAPACFLEEDYMREKGIEFVGIPYNLFRKVEG